MNAAAQIFFHRSPQQYEEQRGVGGVQQHVDEVHRARIQAEQRAVRHVRQPRERMPVAGVVRGECLRDVRPVQTVFDEPIFRDVFWVVIVHEAKPADRQEHDERAEREQQGDEARTRHEEFKICDLRFALVWVKHRQS